MTAKYRNLFIDLDDTLWAFSENARDSFAEVYVELDFGRYFDSFEQFYSIYTERNNALWVDYDHGRITKEELNRERFSYPLLKVGVDDPELVHAYMKAFFRIIPTKQKLMPHARDVLEYLNGKYRLYILSNGFRELQSRKLASAGIEGYFRKVILSEDLKVNKPRAEIFYFALSATQSELRESLMIGDSFDTDIAGARGVGMDQVLYNHRHRTELPFRPTYEVASLTELFDLL